MKFLFWNAPNYFDSLMQAAKNGSSKTVKHILSLPEFQQNKQFQWKCTEALLATLEGLDKAQPPHASEYDKCVEYLLPLAHCPALVHSPKLLKLAKIYTKTMSDNYTHFFLHVEAIVSASKMKPAPAMDYLLQQHLNTRRLRNAAHNGNLAEVKRLIALSVPQANRCLALGSAAQQGHLECVKALLPWLTPQTFDAQEWKPTHPRSALEFAAGGGSMECVKLLLPHAEATTHFPALLAAVAQNRLEVVRLLWNTIAPSDANAVLMAACPKGSVEIVRWLEQCFPTQNLAVGPALEQAATHGNDMLVKHLLFKAPEKYIGLAMHKSLQNGHANCVRHFVRRTHGDHLMEGLRYVSEWMGCNQKHTKTYPSIQQQFESYLECMKVLIPWCNAQRVLNNLQSAHPNTPANWNVLEQYLCEHQRLVLLENLKDASHCDLSHKHNKRKM